MKRTPIAIESWSVKAHELWANQWLLLTAGDFAAGRFNAMTIAWGSFGTMWGKPFAQVVVRPTRFTFEFMEKYPTFTLCAFPDTHRADLQLLGTRSGRNGDKIAESGLTPVASPNVHAPCFGEAELVVECRKIYYDDFKPAQFLDAEIEKNYPNKDYHRIYYGEIVGVWKQHA